MADAELPISEEGTHPPPCTTSNPCLYVKFVQKRFVRHTIKSFDDVKKNDRKLRAPAKGIIHVPDEPVNVVVRARRDDEKLSDDTNLEVAAVACCRSCFCGCS